MPLIVQPFAASPTLRSISSVSGLHRTAAPRYCVQCHHRGRHTDQTIPHSTQSRRLSLVASPAVRPGVHTPNLTDLDSWSSLVSRHGAVHPAVVAAAAGTWALIYPFCSLVSIAHQRPAITSNHLPVQPYYILCTALKGELRPPRHTIPPQAPHAASDRKVLARDGVVLITMAGLCLMERPKWNDGCHGLLVGQSGCKAHVLANRRRRPPRRPGPKPRPHM